MDIEVEILKIGRTEIYEESKTNNYDIVFEHAHT